MLLGPWLVVNIMWSITKIKVNSKDLLRVMARYDILQFHSQRGIIMSEEQQKLDEAYKIIAYLQMKIAELKANS